MIEAIRKIVIEESANFLLVDIDMADFPGKSSLDMMEIFLAEGLLVLHSEDFTKTEKRGWFRSDTYKCMCRVGCQKVHSWSK